MPRQGAQGLQHLPGAALWGHRLRREGTLSQKATLRCQNWRVEVHSLVEGDPNEPGFDVLLIPEGTFGG